MIQINYLAIIVGVVVTVLFGALYYFLLNKQVTALRATKLDKKEDVRTTITPNKLIVEFLRTFVLALVIAYAIQLLGVTNLVQAGVIAFWLWLGFPVVMLVGSVIHEHFPTRLAIIHAGDWLVKILILMVLLTYWR